MSAFGNACFTAALLAGAAALVESTSRLSDKPTGSRQYVDDLMNRMTLPDKIGQLVMFSSDWTATGPSLRPICRDDIRAGKVGAVLNAFSADYTRSLQAIAVKAKVARSRIRWM